MNIPDQIKHVRFLLKESQVEFGERFSVSGVAVSLWEDGKREAPYEVIEFVYDDKIKQYELRTCDKCAGKGYISKKRQEKIEALKVE